MKVRKRISWILVFMLIFSMVTGIQGISPQKVQAADITWNSGVFGNSTSADTNTIDSSNPNGVVVTSGKGKISALADGIAFYNTELDSSSNFTVSADITVNGFGTVAGASTSSTNQRSFGLMFRNSVGTNYDTSGHLSNFLAIGGLGTSTNIQAFGRYDLATITSHPTDFSTFSIGGTYNLSITKSGNKCSVTCTPKGGTAQTYTDIDATNVFNNTSGKFYAGFYAARNAQITCSSIKIIDGSGKSIYDSTPALPSAPVMNAPVAGVDNAGLSWSTVSEAAYYTIKGGTTSGSYNMFYQTPNKDVTTYTYSGLTTGTNYYFVVSASNSSGESINSNEVTVKPAAVLAFPGAEGGGRYTTGGRGYDVYEVTTLDDSGAGSLRDAVSKGNRTIIFKVSGNIELKSRLDIAVSNLTIAGQTAPGDGICVSGFDTRINDGSKNIIIRYMRFRPGDANIDAEPDGIWGRNLENVILDHISSGWSTDESLSFYENKNFTLQWSIASESLTMSGHFKGKHGYGGIWGGNNATFHHNIMAHHTSRNPRIEVGGNAVPAAVDLRNNIIYDWEFNSTYGGDTSSVNVINNYYKPGPMTLDTVKNRIVNPSFPSNWYLLGNYMDGASNVTSDNSVGYQPDATAGATMLASPVSIEGASSVTTQAAADAYNSVLAKAGATLPKRDAVDARVTADIKNGTGRAINRPYEVGGYPEYATASTVPADSDHDGMPDSWEVSKGLDKDNASDGKANSGDGYTNLEKYLNSLVDMNYEATNPTVSITSPDKNSIYPTGGTVQITADAKASTGATIAKVEFYKNDVKLGESTSAPYSYTWAGLPEGTYFVSARATDSNGISTQSNPVPVYVNGTTVSDPWTSTDIGSVGIKGSASLDDSNVMTVKGAGSMLGASDSFQYTYRTLDEDGELSAQIDSIANIEQDAGLSGIMIREDLTPDSPYALLGALHVKASNLSTSTAIEFLNRSAKGENVSILSTPTSSDSDYISDNGIYNISAPYWIKLSRAGNDISAYVSADGTAWKFLGTKTFSSLPSSVYIGFAVDAGKAANNVENYNYARFSNINMKDSATVAPDFVFTTPPPATATEAKFTISGHATVGANVTIMLNKAVLLDNVAKAANEEFTQDLTFNEGGNVIEISMTDADNNTRTFKYNTVYTPASSGGTVINNRKIDVWDFGGVQTSGSLYNNIITRDTLDNLGAVTGGLFTSGATFGDLSIVTTASIKDRLYYYESDTSSTKGAKSYGTWGNSVFSYSDGYSSKGCYYCNGTGGDSRRCLIINNVVAGDKITVYGGTTNGNETMHFTNPSDYTIASGTVPQQDSTAAYTTSQQKVEFVAQYSGSYKIWVSALASGKPYFTRVVRTPGVIVNGSVNLNGADKTGISLTFKNQTTGDLIDVNINDDNTFSTVLPAGYNFTAALKGTISYAVSDATKLVSTTSSEIPYGKNGVTLDVVVNKIATIKGKIDGFGSGYDLSKFKLTFTPPAGSLAEPVIATVDTTAMTFTAVVKADQAYTAVISGVNDYEIKSGGNINTSADLTQNITVAMKPLYTITGKFEGLSSTAAIQSVKFTNVDDSYTYTGIVENGGYTVKLRDGAYAVSAVCSENYTTTGHVVVNGNDVTKDVKFIEVNGWNLVNVTNTDIAAGTYNGLTLVKGTGSFGVNGNALSAKPGSSIIIPVKAGQLVTVSGWYSGEMSFSEDPTNVVTIPSTSSASAPARITYKATTAGTVTLNLTGTATAYLTAISRAQQLDWVSDLYVGDSSKSNNYSTVKEALDAAAQMNPTSEDQRITIHIAPGVYRAQLRISTPYITLTNSDPSKEVKITWYYGIGYKYYSVGSDGFYNEDSAFDQYTKNNAGSGKWGATVFLNSTATGFKANNIVFENSFNKYLTDEELKDGVQRDYTADSQIAVERTASLDVTSKAATERAAAMGIEADNVEFNDCSFVSSQDTLYTGSANNNQYYKDCFIEGNTDYIFGDGNVVFDNCTLNFFGYSNSAVGGYITAAKDVATYGYLFKNCTVTANANNYQSPGYFGRPWAQGAKVTFINTVLQNDSLIAAQGWTDMSGATAEKAKFYEYNTTYNGVKVDTLSRRGKILSDSDAAAISVSNYFGDWTPTYLVTPTWPAASTLVASNVEKNSLTLTWSAASDNTEVTAYKVYNGSTLIKTVSSDVSSIDVTDLETGTYYTFTVQAGDNGDNWSSNGPSVDVKTSSSKKQTDDDTSNTPAPTTPTTTTPTAPATTPTTTETTSGSSISAAAKLDSTTATAKAEISSDTISAALTSATEDSKGVKTATITVSPVEGAKAYEQTLSATTLSESSKGAKIVIDTEVADVEVPTNMLTSAKISADSKASISVGTASTSTITDTNLADIIGTRPAVSFDVKVDGSSVTAPLNGNVKLTIPYTASGDEAEKLTVVKINSDGTSTKIGNTKYEKDSGVTFKTNEPGTYAVVYDPKTFSDLGSYDWAKNQVEVLASKGVINGTAENTFSPSDNIKRADFMMMLVKTLDLKATDATDNFADVKSDDYYSDALSVAKKLGIAQGTGDNKFNPDEEISRQDMMVICERALKLCDMINSKADSKDIDKYSDNSLVSDYAVDGVSTMVKEGIVTGDGTDLDPLGNASRAEIAVIMYRIFMKN